MTPVEVLPALQGAPGVPHQVDHLDIVAWVRHQGTSEAQSQSDSLGQLVRIEGAETAQELRVETNCFVGNTVFIQPLVVR